jgi:hypothetical protein
VFFTLVFLILVFFDLSVFDFGVFYKIKKKTNIKNKKNNKNTVPNGGKIECPLFCSFFEQNVQQNREPFWHFRFLLYFCTALVFCFTKNKGGEILARGEVFTCLFLGYSLYSHQYLNCCF